MSAATTTPTKIAIIYYSTYGHMKVMIEEAKKGLEEAGCVVDVFQAPELLSEDVLAKMGAPPKNDDALLDHTATAKLPEYDGFVFGIPTRFGMMGFQMKAVFDGMGGLWMTGAMIGKPATVIFSTGTQNGGQETTALTTVTQLTHLGMIFVPTGYSFPKMFDNAEVHGGSPWGAGTIANGDGSRMPSDMEKEFAVHHGKHFGGVASALVKGKAV